MRRPRRRNRPLVFALYLNAALLAAVLVVLAGRGGFWGGAPAYAAPQMPPIAGGGGVYVMPAQFAMNSWGCYLLDIDAQTICAYTFDPSAHRLQFAAARNYRFDRQLTNWNTLPDPSEIKRLVELKKNPIRGNVPPADAPPADGAAPADPANVNPNPNPPAPPDGPPAPAVPGEQRPK